MTTTDVHTDKLWKARAKLHGIAHRTPLLTSRILNKKANANVYLKCENFQRVGAFKFRGAYNAISNLPKASKQRGIITHSSGNHAQAVALVGQLLGLQTVVVMPENAPRGKLSATRAYGASVITYDPEKATREAISAGLAEERQLTLIHPYDNADIIAGQGTAAMEMLNEQGLDAVLTPCGGGGLLSGSSLAVDAIQPACHCIGIEPELADDATRSFYSGRIHRIENPQTIADGTRTPSLGDLNFEIIRRRVEAMLTVTEEEIKSAVRFLFHYMKLVVEPSGALPVAALLSGRLRGYKNIGVIISGGNIDSKTMMAILETS